MNEHQARAREAQKAQQQFLQALSAGQVHAVDRFGMPITAGAKVLHSGQIDLVFDVISVAPILDPKVPPGMLNVTVTVTFPMQVRANMINPTLIRLPHLEQVMKPQEPEPAGEDAGAEKPPNNEAHEELVGDALGAGDEAPAAGPRLVLTDRPDDEPL